MPPSSSDLKVDFNFLLWRALQQKLCRDEIRNEACSVSAESDKQGCNKQGHQSNY